MDSATINLTALAEVRSKMTPGEYQVTGEANSDDLDCLIDSPSGLVSATFESARPEEDSRGLVAEHNAIGALIEVARTAIAADEALAAFEAWQPGPARLADDGFMPLLEAARKARAIHRDALAKVSL